MFEVDRCISDASQLNWNAMLEYMKASKNTPCASAGNVGANSKDPNPTLPISSAPSNDTPVSPYFSHNNQLVSVLPSPSPIRSAPYSAAPPSRASYPLGVAIVPNHSSVPMTQANFMANAPTTSAPPVTSSRSDERMEIFRAEMQKMFYDNFGIKPKPGSRIYQKPYPKYFDYVPYPQGYKVPDFAKFNGIDSKSTWEHVSQYLAQLGEASSNDPLKVCLFPLSLTGTAFS